MEVNKETLENCKRILGAHNNIEYVLMYLKEKGYSIIESMIMLTELQGLDLGEAKKLVHFSETWSDVRERNEEFHKSILKALEKELEQEDDQ